MQSLSFGLLREVFFWFPYFGVKSLKLTNSQTVFLKMVKSGTAPRALSNKTGRTLNKMGLIKPNAMYGWILTVAGIDKLKEIE